MTDMVKTVVVTATQKKTSTPRIPKPAFKVITDSVTGDKMLENLDASLLAHLQEATDDLDSLYDNNPRIPVESLFQELADLKAYVINHPNKKLNQLISYLESSHTEQIARLQNMLQKGVVSFGGLRLLLKPCTDVVMGTEMQLGAKVVRTRHVESFMASWLQVEFEYISSNGREFKSKTDEIRLVAYSGVKNISDLPVRPVSDTDMQALTARGKIYQQIALGSHYKEFVGQMEVIKWWNYAPLRATGRCMVDIATYNQFNGHERYNRDSEDERIVTLTPDQLWRTEPYVFGFSFVTKQWGRFPVSQISDIEFRSNAYDQLVLDTDKKDLIRALVQDNSSGFSDIISGKGGGCIFLLHGEPGVGKTLTAEAVSELLQRPLYSVSVGELGTDPASMEKNLRKILDTAQIWNAVILLDEADIFLEKRQSGDILRNACVGVMLRLLEYHQGVMFLTTNRVNDFDQAFYSRISMALKYDALSSEARAQIWNNLLAAAGITGVNTQELSVHPLNGRQIKNTIRMAQSLARQNGVTVSYEQIVQCIDVSRQFVENVG